MHPNFSVKFNDRQVPDEKPFYFADRPDRRDPHTFIKKPKIITYCKGLSRAAKELYEIFVDYGRNGLIFPAVATLAGDMGLSVRQVARLVAELRAAGLIVTRRTGRSNNYYLVELTPDLINLISRARRGQQVEQLPGPEPESQPRTASVNLKSQEETNGQQRPQAGSAAQASQVKTGATADRRRPAENQPARPAPMTARADQADQGRAVIFGSSDLTKMADKEEESKNHVCEPPYPPLAEPAGKGKGQESGISPGRANHLNQRNEPAQAEVTKKEYAGYVALIKMGFSQATARRLVETVERNRPGQTEAYIDHWIKYAQTHARTNPAGYVKTVLADNAELPTPRPATQLHKPSRRPRSGHTPVNLTKWSEYVAQADAERDQSVEEFQAQAESDLEPLAANPAADRPEQIIDRQRYLRYSLQDFDRQAAARLRRLEIDGNTIRASFRGSGEVQLDKWLPQARIYYPDLIRVEIETGPGAWQ
jgi:DNA-binding MarR family transcriptional regulator